MTANVQISGKSQSGIIFVVGGNDVDDFKLNLAGVLGGDTATADQIIDACAALITPASAGGSPAPAGTPADFQQAAANVTKAFPQAQPVVAQGPAPVCAHGQRTYKEGTAASTGRQWRAWMCPAPKGQSCPPEWIR